MYNTINQSFNEVYDIILHSEESIYNRIPINFIKMLEQARDRNYKVNIDYSKSINEQNLLHETRVIMAIIYRDFVCSKEEKERLLKEEKQQYSREQQYIKEKYNPDNVFKNNASTNIQNITVAKESEQKEIVVIERESIITKLVKFINKLFRKKH